MSTQIEMETQDVLLLIGPAIAREEFYIKPWLERKELESARKKQEGDEYAALPWWKKLFTVSPWAPSRYQFREYVPDVKSLERLMALRNGLLHHKSQHVLIGLDELSLLFPKEKS